MDSIGALIVFAIVGAFICARARVAGGAIAFAVVAIVLFIGTPAGSGLPGAVSDFVGTVNRTTTPLLTHQKSGGVG